MFGPRSARVYGCLSCDAERAEFQKVANYKSSSSNTLETPKSSSNSTPEKVSTFVRAQSVRSKSGTDTSGEPTASPETVNVREQEHYSDKCYSMQAPFLGAIVNGTRVRSCCVTRKDSITRALHLQCRVISGFSLYPLRCLRFGTRRVKVGSSRARRRESLRAVGSNPILAGKPPVFRHLAMHFYGIRGLWLPELW